MIPYFPFVEASVMGGGGANIQPLTITQYGDYEIKAPEGVDGYNPIHVNLKDRYQAGYTDGWMKCFLNIKTITITKNGTYNAKSENLEGYNPVVVDVPDRYDEGKNEVRSHIVSKTITANGTYAATAENLEGYNPVIVNVPASETGYTLPPTISAAEFLQFVGGNANVSDETTGYKLVWRYKDNGYKTLCVTNGKAYISLATMRISDYLTVFTIDSSTGKFYAKSNTGSGWSSTVPALIGFGDPSHTNVAENVNK